MLRLPRDYFVVRHATLKNTSTNMLAYFVAHIWTWTREVEHVKKNTMWLCNSGTTRQWRETRRATRLSRHSTKNYNTEMCGKSQTASFSLRKRICEVPGCSIVLPQYYTSTTPALQYQYYSSTTPVLLQFPSTTQELLQYHKLAKVRTHFSAWEECIC